MHGEIIKIIESSKKLAFWKFTNPKLKGRVKNKSIWKTCQNWIKKKFDFRRNGSWWKIRRN